MSEFEFKIKDIDFEYENQKNTFLKNKKWIGNDCLSCGKHFFSKSERSSCGGSECSPEIDFLNDERKSKPITPMQINE